MDEGYGCPAGDPAPPVKTQYTAPELTHTENQASARLCLYPAADMWAFGLIAFQVLTRRHTEGNIVHEMDADAACRLVHPSIPRCWSQRVLWQALDRIRKDTPLRLDLQEQRFLRGFLCQDPAKRKTAEAGRKLLPGVQSLYWHRVPNLCQLLKVHVLCLSHFLTHLQIFRPINSTTLSRIGRQLLIQNVENGSRLTITVERFITREDAFDRRSFHESEAKDALTFHDDMVLSDIVIVKAQIPYRLKITVDQRDGVESLVPRIEDVAVRAPGKDWVYLDFWKHPLWRGREALALLDPLKPGLEVLSRPTPVFGDPSERYVKLEVRVELEVDGETRPVTSSQSILCKVVGRHRQLIFERLKQLAHEWKTKLPPLPRKIGENVLKCMKGLIKRLIF